MCAVVVVVSALLISTLLSLARMARAATIFSLVFSSSGYAGGTSVQVQGFVLLAVSHYECLPTLVHLDVVTEMFMIRARTTTRVIKGVSLCFYECKRSWQ